mmetsp:Transcript_13627/g.33934  ORF Transcript_13627/g.33934 Transcript_13627/m.33934 type:complete len:259 (-) Transcript_13627:239-1015(-)
MRKNRGASCVLCALDFDSARRGRRRALARRGLARHAHELHDRHGGLLEQLEVAHPCRVERVDQPARVALISELRQGGQPRAQRHERGRRDPSRRHLIEERDGTRESELLGRRRGHLRLRLRRIGLRGAPLGGGRGRGFGRVALVASGSRDGGLAAAHQAATSARLKDDACSDRLCVPQAVLVAHSEVAAGAAAPRGGLGSLPRREAGRSQRVPAEAARPQHGWRCVRLRHRAGQPHCRTPRLGSFFGSRGVLGCASHS